MPIAYHFLQQSTRNTGKRIFGFNKAVVDWLMSYQWPGNVRQLRNVVERAVFLCSRSQITLKEIPLFGGMSDIETMLDFVPTTNQELKQVKKDIRQKAVTQVEENFIYNALVRNDWNVTRAARETGLQRPNFHSMMKKHGIKLPPRPKSE